MLAENLHSAYTPSGPHRLSGVHATLLSGRVKGHGAVVRRRGPRRALEPDIEAPTLHARFASYQAPAPRGGEDVRRSLDWMQDVEDESSPKTKMMVVEVSLRAFRLRGLTLIPVLFFPST